MKVLIINSYDIQGGAARAAYRLHQALQKDGVASQMLVQFKQSSDHSVIECNSRKERLLWKVRMKLELWKLRQYRKRTKGLFSCAFGPSGSLAERISRINPDIVHLHWITAAMIPIEELARIRQPIVWSLHDMWPFTGGCHYDEECGKYKVECGACPVLGSESHDDLSKSVLHRKQKAFGKIRDLTVVGLSRWLTECAQESLLFGSRRIVNLPNPIDTGMFKPFDKKQSRELWDIPPNKKLILFGAMGATSDPRKGFEKLRNALTSIEDRSAELLVFGSTGNQVADDFGFKVHYLGELKDDLSLRTLYSAADVMVVPSLQENLSNAIMESLACGTPVVAFDIGGNSDMIEHKYNGYLASAHNTEDLAQGIEWVLSQKDNHLGENARKKVLNEFDASLVAKRYIALYQELLAKMDVD